MPQTKIADRIVEAIRNEILTCQQAPGDKLKIAHLGEKHGVNPGAVREALSTLTAEGLVKSVPQRGFFVAKMSLDELHDITQSRIDIEAICLRRSISKGALDWKSSVVSSFFTLSHTPQTKSLGDKPVLTSEWSQAHSAFHLALVSGCNSPILLEIRNSLYLRSERYRQLSVPLDTEQRDVTAEHQHLVDAALAGDVEKTERLIRAHFEATAKIVSQSLSHL